MSRLQMSPAKAPIINHPLDVSSLTNNIQALLDWPALRDRASIQASFPQSKGAMPHRKAAPVALKSVVLTQQVLIDARLNAWLKSAPAAEQAARTTAVQKLRDAQQQQFATVNLDGLGLSTLPDCLSSLTSLRNLSLRDNQLTSLPPLPANLVELKVGSNRLTSLPGLPASLQELSVYRNALERLPALPPKLTKLHAYENALVDLPKLPSSLQRLTVSGNALQRCPVMHPALTLANLSGNPLRDLPADVLGQVERLSNSAEVLRQHQSLIHKTTTAASVAVA